MKSPFVIGLVVLVIMILSMVLIKLVDVELWGVPIITVNSLAWLCFAWVLARTVRNEHTGRALRFDSGEIHSGTYEVLDYFLEMEGKRQLLHFLARKRGEKHLRLMTIPRDRVIADEGGDENLLEVSWTPKAKAMLWVRPGNWKL